MLNTRDRLVLESRVKALRRTVNVRHSTPEALELARLLRGQYRNAAVLLADDKTESMIDEIALMYADAYGIADWRQLAAELCLSVGRITAQYGAAQRSEEVAD